MEDQHEYSKLRVPGYGLGINFNLREPNLEEFLDMV